MRAPYTAVLASMVVAASACIDDPASLSEDPIPITEAEAELLGLGLWRQSLEAGLAVEQDSGPSSSLRVAGVPEVFAATDSTTVTCTLGGSVSVVATVSGSYDADAGTAELGFSVRETHDWCRERDGETTYTLIGAPDVTVAFDFRQAADGAVDVTGALTGGIVAFTGGRSLYCELDLAVSGRIADGVTTTSVRGTVCGAAVDESSSEPA